MGTPCLACSFYSSISDLYFYNEYKSIEGRSVFMSVSRISVSVHTRYVVSVVRTEPWVVTTRSRRQPRAGYTCV